MHARVRSRSLSTPRSVLALATCLFLGAMRLACMARGRAAVGDGCRAIKNIMAWLACPSPSVLAAVDARSRKRRWPTQAQAIAQALSVRAAAHASVHMRAVGTMQGLLAPTHVAVSSLRRPSRRRTHASCRELPRAVAAGVGARRRVAEASLNPAPRAASVALVAVRSARVALRPRRAASSFRFPNCKGLRCAMRR